MEAMLPLTQLKSEHLKNQGHHQRYLKMASLLIGARREIQMAMIINGMAGNFISLQIVKVNYRLI